MLVEKASFACRAFKIIEILRLSEKSARSSRFDAAIFLKAPSGSLAKDDSCRGVALLWPLMPLVTRSIDEIVDRLAAEYDIDSAICRKNVSDVVSQFRSLDLLVP